MQSATTGFIKSAKTYYDKAIEEVEARAKIQLKTTDKLGIQEKNTTILADVYLKMQLSIEYGITDNIVEDLSFITQNIVRYPKKMTLEFLTSEYVSERSILSKIGGELSNRFNTLDALQIYAPQTNTYTEQQVKKTATKVLTTADYIAGALSTGASILDTLGVEGLIDKKSRQKDVLTNLEKLGTTATTFKVITPWGVFDNMIIQKITPSLQPNTDKATTFIVEMKEVRMQSISYTSTFNPNQYSEGTATNNYTPKPDAKKQEPLQV